MILPLRIASHPTVGMSSPGALLTRGWQTFRHCCRCGEATWCFDREDSSLHAAELHGSAAGTADHKVMVARPIEVADLGGHSMFRGDLTDDRHRSRPYRVADRNPRYAPIQSDAHSACIRPLPGAERPVVGICVSGQGVRLPAQLWRHRPHSSSYRFPNSSIFCERLLETWQFAQLSIKLRNALRRDLLRSAERCFVRLRARPDDEHRRCDQPHLDQLLHTHQYSRLPPGQAVRR